MPERIAVHRIIRGDGASRETIEPGKLYNFPADELKDLEASGAVRDPRDDEKPARREPAASTRAVAEPVGEGEEQAGEGEEQAEKPAAGRRGRGRTDLDEL